MRGAPFNKKTTNPSKPKQKVKETLKKFLPHLKKHYISIILSLLFALTGTILAIIGPNEIQKIMSLILVRPIVFAKITKIAIGLGILYITSFGLTFIQSFVMNGVSAKLSRDLKTKMVEKINNLPLNYLDTNNNGEILSKITNDVDTLNESLGSSLTSLITASTTVVGSAIMMFSYSVTLTLIALVIIPISFVVALTMFRLSQKYFKLQQEKLGEINSHVEESYSSHNIIKTYNAQEKSLEKFDKINKELYVSSYKGQVVSGLLYPIMHFFGNLGYTLIIIVSAIYAIKDIQWMAIAMSFLIYYRMFNNQVGQIANLSSSLQSALASIERITDFLDEKEEENEKNKVSKIENFEGNIELKNVNFGYLPEKQILFDLNTYVKSGQKVAIVGSTGAGKTTLVNLLMRFYDVNSGEILIDGIDIKNIKKESVRKLFGMVLQDAWLFEGTIKDNIAYGKSGITNEQVTEICQTLGIHHLIMSQPDGYHTVLTENSNFSIGERQLITIARAMLHNPPMLILDEATSSVDTRTEVLIQKAMNKLMSGRTTFVIAHRLSTIISADKILVMKDGKIVESGKHKELTEKNGVYATLYKAQF